MGLDEPRIQNMDEVSSRLRVKLRFDRAQARSRRVRVALVAKPVDCAYSAEQEWQPSVRGSELRANPRYAWYAFPRPLESQFTELGHVGDAPPYRLGWDESATLTVSGEQEVTFEGIYLPVSGGWIYQVEVTDPAGTRCLSSNAVTTRRALFYHTVLAPSVAQQQADLVDELLQEARKAYAELFLDLAPVRGGDGRPLVSPIAVEDVRDAGSAQELEGQLSKLAKIPELADFFPYYMHLGFLRNMLNVEKIVLEESRFWTPSQTQDGWVELWCGTLLDPSTVGARAEPILSRASAVDVWDEPAGSSASSAEADPAADAAAEVWYPQYHGDRIVVTLGDPRQPDFQKAYGPSPAYYRLGDRRVRVNLQALGVLEALFPDDKYQAAWAKADGEFRSWVRQNHDSRLTKHREQGNEEEFLNVLREDEDSDIFHRFFDRALRAAGKTAQHDVTIRIEGLPTPGRSDTAAFQLGRIKACILPLQGRGKSFATTLIHEWGHNFELAPRVTDSYYGRWRNLIRDQEEHRRREEEERRKKQEEEEQAAVASRMEEIEARIDGLVALQGSLTPGQKDELKSLCKELLQDYGWTSNRVDEFEALAKSEFGEAEVESWTDL